MITLSDLEALPGILEGAIKRIDRLERAAEHRTRELPAWLSLRDACRNAGVSYESIRRPEHAHLQPNHGVADSVFRGRRMWRKSSIQRWIDDLGQVK